MGRGNTCTICRHDQLKAIDVALSNRKTSREVAVKFGVSDRAVDRHRLNHLRPALRRAASTRADLSAQALVERLVDLLERCDRAMDATENDRDFKTLGLLIRECRELTVTVGRTLGMWTDKPAIVNDNRQQLMVNLDARTMDELLKMRAGLEELGVVPALPASDAS